MAEKTILGEAQKSVAKQNGGGAVETPRRKVYPRLDIFETADAYGVRAYLPGVDRDSIRIDLEDGTLTLQAAVTERAPEGVRYLLQEYRPSDYFHRLQVGDGIDTEKVNADYADGVLTLDLPKVEAAKPRRISIKR